MPQKMCTMVAVLVGKIDCYLPNKLFFPVFSDAGDGGAAVFKFPVPHPVVVLGLNQVCVSDQASVIVPGLTSPNIPHQVAQSH